MATDFQSNEKSLLKHTLLDRFKTPVGKNKGKHAKVPNIEV